MVVNFKGKFYITTPIYYLNAEPHIGHAYTTIAADIISRFFRLKGRKVFFLTGTDEHGQKNEMAAKEAGKNVKDYVDEMALKFKNAWKKLNISFDDFIRTTEERHKSVVKKLIKKIWENGDIYKGYYEGLYCTGCESFKSGDELVNGKCPDHPSLELQNIKEEGYFFKLSKYRKKLLKTFEKNFILPKKRKEEIIKRLKELKDLCITRPKERVSWGIDFPIDKKYVVYVWFDALTNYISALGWPENRKFKQFWPADLHLVGKEILWFHTAIWFAILLSAGIKLPRKVFAHGWWTVEGKKMSKSLGNIIDPVKFSEKYSVDSIRYFLFREIPFGEDGDFSEKKFVERNNGELVETIGNFIHRTLTFVWNYFSGKVPKPKKFDEADKEFLKKTKELVNEYEKSMENFELFKALSKVLELAILGNQYFQKKEPWKTKNENCIFLSINAVKILAVLLYPFLPYSSEKILGFLNLKIKSFKDAKVLIKANKINEPKIVFEKFS